MAGISLGDLKAFKSYAKLIHSKMQPTTRTSKTSDGIVAEKDQLLDSCWAILTLQCPTWKMNKIIFVPSAVIKHGSLMFAGNPPQKSSKKYVFVSYKPPLSSGISQPCLMTSKSSSSLLFKT
jgi:hypothetical protein